MRVIIFGATGTIGQHLTKRALSQNYQVTAFARRPEAMKISHENLTFCAGDVMDPVAVSDAVAGHDAVMVVLGGGMKDSVRSDGTKHVIDAMHQHGVRRLICETTLGAGDSVDNLNFLWRYIMFGMFLRGVYKDHLLQEQYVMDSNLDWTIVRPAALTDAADALEFKHGFPPTEKNLTLKIARLDVAEFMLQQLTSNTYLHKTPGLSY